MRYVDTEVEESRGAGDTSRIQGVRSGLPVLFYGSAPS